MKMKKLLSISTLLLLFNFNQSDIKDSVFSADSSHYSFKFDAAIAVMEYGETDPVHIVYKVYPYGGSGNYVYRWRLYGESFDEEGTDIFEIYFHCLPNGEEQNNKVYCEVTDLDTDEKFVAEHLHPVIPCYTLN